MKYIELLVFERRKEYVEYYRGKEMEYENVCGSVKKSDCLM
jgi:hypothetical protein